MATKTKPPRTRQRSQHIVRSLLNLPKGKRPDLETLIWRLREGLEVRELEELRTVLDVSATRMAELLGISRATFQRRSGGGRLKQTESDRVVRFARIMGLAMEALESEESARQWLNTPQVALGGAVPLDYARTELGAREVEDMLGRIDEGVYS